VVVSPDFSAAPSSESSVEKSVELVEDVELVESVVVVELVAVESDVVLDVSVGGGGGGAIEDICWKMLWAELTSPDSSAEDSAESGSVLDDELLEIIDGE
jgi:hypothetical protein